MVVPHPVDDNGVDEGGEEEGVAEVSLESSALSDGAGDNGGSGRREGPLEQEVVPALFRVETFSVLISGEGERARADEAGRLALLILAISDAVAVGVEDAEKWASIISHSRKSRRINRLRKISSTKYLRWK